MSPYAGGSLGSFFDDGAQKLTEGAAREFAEKGARRIEELAKANTPVETGALRAAWERLPAVPMARAGDAAWEAIVRNGTDYACVFGASTSVLTAHGAVGIGRVRVGDLVMTQTGDWRPVEFVNSFPAMEKPDLIDIEVAWRAGRSHKLTLTLDHKVLVQREARLKWVCAGDLRSSDCLLDRRKTVHNAGSRRVKTCEQCGNRHTGQGRRYCSLRCRDAAWAAGANPHLGATRSAETRRLIGLAHKGRGVALNRLLAARGHRTRHEQEVEQWLLDRDVAYEREYPIGGHVVDFFLPAQREVIEADGAYWHQDQERDLARDRDLLSAAPGVEITHLHFFEKRFTPPLDPEPLAGVRYVVCNPSPSSYADPSVFHARPILSLREWKYGVRMRKTGPIAPAMLYDIGVRGVHSFVANGLIISNSYVENGTGIYGPEHAPYVIKPKLPGGVLRWIGKDGQVVFARSVLHPGSPGNHMLAIAMNVTAGEVEGGALFRGDLELFARAVEANAMRGTV